MLHTLADWLEVKKIRSVSFLCLLIRIPPVKMIECFSLEKSSGSESGEFCTQPREELDGQDFELKKHSDIFG